MNWMDFGELLIFWNGISGKNINWGRVADVYGYEKSHRMRNEIKEIRGWNGKR